MTLSICSICQDEEDVIGWFLTCCEYISKELKNDFKELIVVDGGSKDNTVDIIKSYSNRLPIILLEHPFDNFGQQKNRALERATGDYILGLDSDMTITKNFPIVFRDGYFAGKPYWDFPMLFTAQDAYHFYHEWPRGNNMRLWKRGPIFRTNFHEKLEGQPSSGLPVCWHVTVFENSTRASDQALINRGERYQKFIKEMEAEGGGPGPADRYIGAKRNCKFAPLPENIKNLVIEGT